MFVCDTIHIKQFQNHKGEFGMSIKKYTVSRDDTRYHAWPDLVLTKRGKLICVFTETTHHGDRNNSRIMITESLDRGRSWSEKKALTELTSPGDELGYFNCSRISDIGGKLAIVCDRVINGTDREARFVDIYIWYSQDDGESWSCPQIVKNTGIVPDKLKRLKNGRLLLAAHNGSKDALSQYLWYSDDDGKSWSERVTVASDPRYSLCEVSIYECDDGTLVSFLRENSHKGISCLKTISYDNGESWSEIYDTHIPAVHRPVITRLSSGTLMMSYRFMHGVCRNAWMAQNVFLAFFDEDTAKSTDKTATNIISLDYDRSSDADCGYTGAVQFEDGMIYVVCYIVDDAPKAQIRGYSFYEKELLTNTNE